MAKILTIVDDLTGAPNASERWVAISDGKKVYRLEIDLVDRNYSSMEKAFKDALSRWLVNGEVSVVKVADLPQAIEGSKGAETIVSDADLFAEIEAPKPAPTPEPEPTPEPTPEPRRRAAPKSLSRRASKPAPGVKVVGEGAPRMNDYYLAKTARPGIRLWWGRNWELLQLPPHRNGRVPVTVEEAFDRYQGKTVTTNDLHPVDLERLTAPGNNGKTPTPKELFNNGG